MRQSLFLILGVCFLSISQANGSNQPSWSGFRLALTAEAKSPRALKRIMMKANQREVVAATCEFELQLRRYPVSCFERLKIDRELGFLKTSDAREKINALEDFCREADLRDSAEGLPASKVANPLWVRSECRRKYLESQKIERYKGLGRDRSWPKI